MEDIIHEIYTVGPNFKQVRVLDASLFRTSFLFWESMTRVLLWEGLQLLVALQALLPQGRLHQQASRAENDRLDYQSTKGVQASSKHFGASVTSHLRFSQNFGSPKPTVYHHITVLAYTQF